MAILEFECHGYDRMALRKIQTVTMKPKSKLQMILGTNGAGKTALMKELSPLLSKHSDYSSEGYKRIVVSKGDDIYECMCDFRGVKHAYTIIKNGETLCSGHSSTVYQNLILQELNLTPEIHDIRIGSKRFTTMDVAARRAWFTKLCPENYNYAIGYFKRLSEATRDISGTIKRIHDKIMKERAKLIDEEEEKRIRSEIVSLTETKNSMLQHWRPMEESVDQSLGKVQEIDDELTNLVHEFEKTLKVFCNARGYKSQQDIWNDIADAQAKLMATRGKIDELCEQIENNRILLEKARVSMDKDLQTITKELADTSRELMAVKLTMKSDDWVDSAEQALSAYDNIFGELRPLLDELVEDPTMIYTPEYHAVKATEYQRLLETNNSAIDSLRALTRDMDVLNHRKEQNHTQCPKCNHVWSRGYSEDESNLIQAKIKDLSELVEANQARLSEIQAHLDISSQQNKILDHITVIARSNPVLAPMWRDLNVDRLMRRDPKAAVMKLAEIRQQIELTVEFLRIKEVRNELEIKKAAAVETSGVDCATLLSTNETLEAKLHYLYNDQRFYTSLVDGLKAAQIAMDFQERFTPTADALMMKRAELISKAEVANHHMAVNSIMMNLDSEITQRERMLSQIDAQHALIKSLEEEVEACKAKEGLMKKAMEALSPSGGLIAQGLTGFINHFIAQMNAIIEKVWLYPLVVKPVKVSEDTGVDLDYKFAYSVDGRDAGKDISEGSGAQKEIFDLAFMLVSMVHLGLDDTEIFLDEFSIKMDYAHRKEAMRMVMDLINSSNFSQIFMISHYESSYGTLSDADITVLCPENIQLPADLKYNINSKVVQ